MSGLPSQLQHPRYASSLLPNIPYQLHLQPNVSMLCDDARQKGATKLFYLILMQDKKEKSLATKGFCNLPPVEPMIYLDDIELVESGLNGYEISPGWVSAFKTTKLCDFQLGKSPKFYEEPVHKRPCRDLDLVRNIQFHGRFVILEAQRFYIKQNPGQKCPDNMIEWFRILAAIYYGKEVLLESYTRDIYQKGTCFYRDDQTFVIVDSDLHSHAFNFEDAALERWMLSSTSREPVT
ncbi:hypothetical protein B7494_g5195 [Chlorociboria aeruginascens]|nr:hypothetical protein B7494_g5195 [Chlorociboria aeruginascens]